MLIFSSKLKEKWIKIREWNYGNNEPQVKEIFIDSIHLAKEIKFNKGRH